MTAKKGMVIPVSFRHELKHEITHADRLALRAALSAAAKPDQNGNAGLYEIRSLYFDDLQDTALREKIDGVNLREKFRLRYYNGDSSFIRLEKKSKVNGLCLKQGETLNTQQAAALLEGDTSWMLQSGKPLIQELYHKMRCKGLRPKAIVDYTREAFTFPAGNVRITLDYNIRTSLSCAGFLSPSCVSIPAGEGTAILELKWDAYLPDIIRDIVQIKGCRASAFSKYAACRIYG